jgi:phosphoglycolate phosphatase-like HAD superfamily hydrolase
MKKDTLIDLYGILDAVQRGGQPDAGRVGVCFIALRDALMDPDTEQIVDHIRGVLERSEAAADVLAIGDGRNDIEMITWAGRGVALGDAAEEVARAADHVTGTFAAGGTVAELRRWFS